ncbi:hypothetical protein EIP75_16125 [Aquabacterium soli]|uniref:Uncharacterized protein n=1 Tax=Aquabacterium soli TaxID=2493092 RepID=A0A426V910_9BURK|nr:hypothetical protein [Aquabacterium soli]RRS03218.1 hypothetical protein EIP75_16125 [Aquabacterium soli]
MPTNDFMGNGHTRAKNSPTQSGEPPPDAGPEASNASVLVENTTPLVITTGAGRVSFWEMRGSRAQLEAEGVVPEGAEWPRGGARLFWQTGEFRYVLRRTRPEGLKGPMRLWTNGDLWVLRCHLANPDHDARELAEKRKALADELHRQSHDGFIQLHCFGVRVREAAADSGFQAFKARLLPVAGGAA